MPIFSRRYSPMPQLRQWTAFACVAAALCAPVANAQSQNAEPIQTDRPDFVESSNVVGAGGIQLETSIAYERSRRGGVLETAASTPTLIRIGTGRDWELRLETDGYTRQQAVADAGGERLRVHGYADLSVGAKWHVQDQLAATPSLALLVHADLDSGSAPLRGNGVRPSVRMVAEWEMPADMSLGLMPGIAYEKTADGRRFYQGIWGMVIGKAWTGRFRTFAEFAAPAIARSRYGASFSTYNVGAAYLLSDDCQLDVSMQQGASRSAPGRAWSLGLSRRF
jgi:hypothetical protein